MMHGEGSVWGDRTWGKPHGYGVCVESGRQGIPSTMPCLLLYSRPTRDGGIGPDRRVGHGRRSL